MCQLQSIMQQKIEKRAFLWSLLSGISEPLRSVIGFFILALFIATFVLNLALAFVAGIMIFISFDELLPLSLGYREAHLAITSLFIRYACNVFNSITFLDEKKLRRGHRFHFSSCGYGKDKCNGFVYHPTDIR